MVENSSKPWTSEEEDRLRELVISNAAAFDIAAELGRTVSAVKARAQALGLTPGRLRSNRSSSRNVSQGEEISSSGRVKPPDVVKNLKLGEAVWINKNSGEITRIHARLSKIGR